MALFDLVRVARAPDGAFGMLVQDSLPFALTLERTYGQELEPQALKIPPGLYVCRRRAYNRGGYDSYEITGVDGHTLLLFHKGNLEHDADGCVLLGRRLGFLRGQPAILESSTAFADFMRRTGGRAEWQLRVLEVEA